MLLAVLLLFLAFSAGLPLAHANGWPAAALLVPAYTLTFSLAGHALYWLGVAIIRRRP